MRYPKPLNDKEWNYLIRRLDQPLSEDQKKNLEEMVRSGSRIKVYLD
ncbi:MAG: hypothetical protein MRJ93_12000 [Nitrososphaeraceae archaeon]|nr:hypothetical protein [Nitrososphaeraceae archaeon]